MRLILSLTFVLKYFSIDKFDSTFKALTNSPTYSWFFKVKKISPSSLSCLINDNGIELVDPSIKILSYGAFLFSPCDKSFFIKD